MQGCLWVTPGLALGTYQAAATIPMDFFCQTGSPKPSFHILQGLHFS